MTLSRKVKILFLTTANLTTNPRLLKELKFFHDKYDCSFVGFRLGNWSDELDLQHQMELPTVNFQYLTATRAPFLPWLWSSVVHRFAQKIYPFSKKTVNINAYASDKRAFLLNKYLARQNGNYDLVIAHNLGALYPTWRFGSNNNIPFSFDIEDYHPGEKISKDIKNEQHRRAYLLNKLLPDAFYVSYASPLIGDKIHELMQSHKIEKYLLINNSFDATEFVQPEKIKGKLKLVWFSQYIDSGRGVEKLLSMIDNFHGKVELHLIGSPRSHFVERYIKGRKYIKLHGTMTQNELHIALAGFDVGLALESIEQDQNRDICLTNKIWAYTQAGLYVIATNTSAQKQFIIENPWVGSLIELRENTIMNKIEWLLDNIENIRKEKMNRFEKAKDLSWEKEGEKLKGVIASILK